jgi:general nucleoside transport system permease protein
MAVAVATLPGTMPPWVRTALRLVLALAIALSVFGVALLAAGKDPVAAYRDILMTGLGSSYGRGEIAVRAVPFILAALATAIPARAGLVNVGAEGQLAAGMVAATAGALALGPHLPGIFLIPLLGLIGMAGGALWGFVPGILRVKANLNETISTLMLNYVALLLVQFMIIQVWRDPRSPGFPQTAKFANAARLPIIFGSRVHLGVVIAPLVALAAGLVLYRTKVGFNLRVVGGNHEAARRAGLPAGRILVLSMLAGGAIAGLAGMIEVTGLEGRLRPETALGYGYIGFLASWLARHRPGGIVGAGVLFSIIAVGGYSLQIGAGLPSSSVQILMALVLFAMLDRGREKSLVAA